MMRRLRTGRSWGPSLVVLFLVLCCLVGVRTHAADQPPPDPATRDAVNTALQIATTAADIHLSPEETGVVSDLLLCTVAGAPIAQCGRNTLEGQLPAPARPLADCMLKGGNLPTCAQEGLVGLLDAGGGLLPGGLALPDSVKPTAKCLLGSALNGGSSVADCVRDAVVNQIPDPNIQALASCVLKGQQAAGCATDALVSQLGPDAGPVAQCLIKKTAPAAQCIAQAAGPLPPELKCLADQASAPGCLKQAVIDRLPDGPQKDLAKCMVDPATAKQCAQTKIASALGQDVGPAAECIAKSADPATCTGFQVPGSSFGDALDMLNKMMGTPQMVDPGKTPSSLANLLKVADGIRHDDWEEVLTYGGAEVAKATAKIVFRVFADGLTGPLGELLNKLAGPIIDTEVQDRAELVSGLIKELKKCKQGNCDEAKIGEILGEFYMLLAIEVPCALLSAPGIPESVRQVTCGPLGQAILTVGSAGYEFYKDNDKTLAAVASVLFPGSGIAEAIVALDPDFQNAIVGKHGECPANYFSSHIAICFRDAAYLGMVDPRRAAALTKSINDACHQDFKNCSQRNAVGNVASCIGGLFGGDGCANDSDRIAKQCDPTMDALKKAADELRTRVEGLAAEYVADDALHVADFCSPGPAIDALVKRCASALPAKLPGINDANWAACNVPGRNLPPADLFGAACRAAALAQERVQRRQFVAQNFGVQLKLLTDMNKLKSFPGLNNAVGKADQAAADSVLKSYCDKKQACMAYAQAADQARSFNESAQCGGVGPRWTASFDEHLKFCMSAPDEAVKAETQARQDVMGVCQTCQLYAQLAVSQAQGNADHQCGGVGPRWTIDYGAHMRFCMSAPEAAASDEVDARQVWINDCERCKDYASSAVSQAQANADKHCGGVGPRWDINFNQHMLWCHGAGPGGTDSERTARDTFLRQCLKPATPAPSQPVVSPPVQPCAAGSHSQDGACVPDAQACAPPFIGTQPNCRCPPGLVLNGNSCVQPAAQACAPPFIGTGPNCRCPPGLVLNGNSCVQPAAQACDPPFIGTKPNCRCPAGLVQSGNSCVQPAAQACDPPFIGTKPNCRCPAGLVPNGNNCVQPAAQACAPPFIGTKPNCRCPAGLVLSGNSCVQPAAQACDPPFIGTKPNCRCPAGLVPSGNSCVQPAAQACDPPFIGTRPNCRCPAGLVLSGNNCVQPAAQACDPPFIGTKPNCRCPAGAVQNNGSCVRPGSAEGCAPGQRRGPDGVCFSCSHNDHFDASGRCVPCQTGSHVEGEQCVPDKPPGGTGGQPGGTPGPAKCGLGELGTPPNCKCPLGMLGKPPTCCPPGQFKDGQCIKPPAATVCPPERPVGTPPNCCPRGREAKNGICVSACPPGYDVLDKPNKYGSYCAEPCAKAQGEVRYPDGQCSCPVGQGRFGPHHSCAPPPKPAPVPTPVGPTPHRTCTLARQVFDSQTGQCICPPGTGRNPDGSCYLNDPNAPK